MVDFGRTSRNPSCLANRAWIKGVVAKPATRAGGHDSYGFNFKYSMILRRTSGFFWV